MTENFLQIPVLFVIRNRKNYFRSSHTVVNSRSIERVFDVG